MQPPIMWLAVVGGGEEVVVVAHFVLGFHHDILVGRERAVLRHVPLLPWHGLPHRLDLVELRLPEERRHHQDVGHPVDRQRSADNGRLLRKCCCAYSILMRQRPSDA